MDAADVMDLTEHVYPGRIEGVNNFLNNYFRCSQTEEKKRAFTHLDRKNSIVNSIKYLKMVLIASSI